MISYELALFSESKTVQAVQFDSQAIISYKSVCLSESKTHHTSSVNLWSNDSHEPVLLN